MENNHDINEQLEALRAENKRLKKESNLKTAWISLLSHDFKGAFSSLLTLLDAREQNAISDADFFQLLPQVRQDAQRNLKSITATSDWIKTQQDGFRLRPSEVYAAELFVYLKQEFKESFQRKRIRFILEGPETSSIHTDRLLIQFILKGLVDNAIKYSYPDSTIVFKVADSDQGTTFSIIDEGMGMDQKHVDSIFTFDSPVFRSTEGETGAGISIKIIKIFVSLLGGIIEIESKMKMGTTVSVFLHRI
ncbi:HAMP domain-containing histidine kinase [Membranicola marinus]|uniref:histidine kinase n=1 Tax=Membranihabitans marinus TaxID=1227546 RepID=A0A953LCN4_9BACT|nr:HAMP domain-containing sensor histidine kinase [Membranihabitans marinus]MBY5957974.1 HAMP domain-containing histidine kinase [Membranihabitans marinus]